MLSRKSHVNQQDVLKAESLRRSGCTYKEVMERMGGAVSLDWCKRNLKHIKEDSPESRAKEDILRLALRPEGVTYPECCEVFLNNEVCTILHHEENGEDTMYTTYKKVKDSLKNKHGDEVVFRPLWMRPDDALYSLSQLNILADELNQRFEAYIDDYMVAVYPEDFSNVGIRRSTASELALVAIPFKSVEGVLTRCARNVKLAEQLDERAVR